MDNVKIKYCIKLAFIKYVLLNFTFSIYMSQSNLKSKVFEQTHLDGACVL